MKLNKPIVIFTLSLLFIYTTLSIGRYIHFKPTSIHQWAQSDRASIAKNYYQEDMNFFLPRVKNISNGTGITGLEFPILNYLASICYKLFGFDEFWYRLIDLIILSVGLIFLFKLSYHFLDNTFQSLAIVLIFYLSPILVYYSANFIPDAPSLGFILIGWYYLFRYKVSNKNIHLMLFTFFVILSVLIKITSLISVFTILGILILDKFNFFNRIEFRNKGKLYVSLIFVCIIVSFWYFYSNFLNQEYHSGFFLMSIKPVNNLSELYDSIDYIIYFWFSDYYSTISILIICIAFFYLLFNFKKGNYLLNTITILLMAGDICFFLLMLFQFRDHDYYIITLLVPIAFLFLSTLLILKEKKITFNALSNSLIIIFVLNNLLYCKNNLKDRFDYKRDKFYFGNAEFYNRIKKINQNKEFMGIKNDKVFSVLYDKSPNNVLYMIDKKGYNIEGNFEDSYIEKLFNKSDYVLIDSKYINDKLIFQKYLTNRIIENDSISIYKLK